MPGPVPGPRDARSVLEQQLAVQARIVGLAQTLLSLPAEDLDQGIQEQLGVAAELARVERTRLVVGNATTGRVASAYDWSNSALADPAPIEGDVMRRFPWASGRILRGEVVQITS